jgi:hypothetical protein
MNGLWASSSRSFAVRDGHQEIDPVGYSWSGTSGSGRIERHRRLGWVAEAVVGAQRWEPRW